MTPESLVLVKDVVCGREPVCIEVILTDTSLVPSHDQLKHINTVVNEP